MRFIKKILFLGFIILIATPSAYCAFIEENEPLLRRRQIEQSLKEEISENLLTLKQPINAEEILPPLYSKLRNDLASGISLLNLTGWYFFCTSSLLTDIFKSVSLTPTDVLAMGAGGYGVYKIIKACHGGWPSMVNNYCNKQPKNRLSSVEEQV